MLLERPGCVLLTLRNRFCFLPIFSVAIRVLPQGPAPHREEERCTRENSDYSRELQDAP